MGTAYSHRPRLIIETEINAATWALAEADALSELTGDYTEGDKHMARLLELSAEAAAIPHQRPAS